MVSAVVGAAGLALAGRVADPSKCPQNPFARTASSKRKTKIAQLHPDVSSLGTDEDRASDKAVVTTEDMVSDYVDEPSKDLDDEQLAKRRAHNLLEWEMR